MTYEDPADGEALLELWRCDDDYCDCSQLRVVRITWRALHPSGRRWYDRATLWEGAFHTDHERPDAAEWAMAIQAAEQHGATIADWMREEASGAAAAGLGSLDGPADLSATVDDTVYGH